MLLGFGLQVPDDTKLILQAVKVEPNEVRSELVSQVIKDPETTLPSPSEKKHFSGQHENLTQVRTPCFVFFYIYFDLFHYHQSALVW